jgi:hypothetical protein
VTGTFLPVDLVTKPTQRPSGEKNGAVAGAVPSIRRASSSSSLRM